MSNSAEEDIEMMRALQAGNDWPLGVLMSRWKQPIANHLYRLLGNYHEAAEIAQEVFIKVYFKRDSFDTGKSFSSWIYAIAGNLAKNKLRWWSRHPSAPIPEEGLLGDSPSFNSPSESEETLKICLDKLPAELREVLVLFDVEDKSHIEISEIIGKSAKTVAARLYKARELLKKAYVSVSGNGALAATR